MQPQHLFTAGALFAVAFASTACSSSNTSSASDAGTSSADSGAMAMKMSDPAPATQAVLAKTTNYKTWSKFDENQTPKLSQSHMNMWVLAYHNDVVTQAIANKTLPLPDGAIITKENYAHATDTMPMTITTMSKQAGAWYWIESTPDGKVVDDPVSGAPYEGTSVTMCTGCHQSKATTNDWVFTHDFTK